MRRLPENKNCAKCGKKINYWNIAYDSGNSYIIDDTYNIELDKRFPEHPYKEKKLCRTCYEQVWKEAPPLPNQTKMEKDQKNKVTISTLLYFILIIITLYQLFSGGWALLNAVNISGLSKEASFYGMITFVYSMLLIAFFWGIVYYLGKAINSRQ